MEGFRRIHSEVLDSRAGDWADAIQQHKTKRKYSLDALLRPNRTQTSHSASVSSPQPPVPQPLDYCIAQALLTPNSVLIPKIPSIYKMPMGATEAGPSHIPRFVPQRYEGSSNITEQSTSSQTVFDPADHRYVDAFATKKRETSESVKLYNVLAHRNGLMILTASNLTEVSPSTEQLTAAGSSSKASRGQFARRVLRRVTSSASVGALRRVASTATLGRSPRSTPLGYQSLEMAARLAGTNVLRLDKTLSPMPLVLPGPLFATASYLQDQARTTPHLFQDPGNLQVANTIYSHLVRYLDGVCHDEVEQIVGHAVLPTRTNALPYTGHDISSTFKKLVRNTPGGVLGSLGLFLALRDIEVNFPVNNSATKALQTTMKCRLIALAISSITSQLRYNVVCAFFGLAAMVAEKEGALQTENLLGTMVPSPVVKSLSIIFGPYLLANLQDEIDASPQYELGERSVEKLPARGVRKAWRTFLGGKSTPTELEKTSADGERYRQCSAVIEMVLSQWKVVVNNLKLLRGLNKDPSKPPSSLPEVRGGIPSTKCQARTSSSSEDQHLLSPAFPNASQSRSFAASNSTASQSMEASSDDGPVEGETVGNGVLEIEL